MRRLVVLVLLAGCGDIATVTADSAQGGSGGSASTSGGGGQAGTAVPGSDGGVDMITRTCDAPQASLNGTTSGMRAVYVPGSLAAVDPAAPTDDAGGTCAEWADDFNADPGRQHVVVQEMNVVDGMLRSGSGPMPTELVGAMPGDAGCLYTLRATSTTRAVGWPCAVTLDYQLPQP